MQKLTTGMLLSEEQRTYATSQIKRIREQIQQKQTLDELSGIVYLISRYEAFNAILELDRVECKRMERLGDNAVLADFIQAKE